MGFAHWHFLTTDVLLFDQRVAVCVRDEPGKGWSASKLPCAKPWWPYERWPGGKTLGRPAVILHFSTQTHLRGDHQTCPTNHPAAFASDRKDTSAFGPQDCLFDSESESRQQWDDTIYIYVYVYFTFYFTSSTKQEVCIFQFFNSCWPARNPSSYPFNLHLCSDKSVCSQFHNFTPSAWTGCNARGSPAWKKWHADKAQQFGNDFIGTCVRTTLSMFLCKSCNQISTESEREDVHIMHIFMHHGKNTKKLNRIKIDQLFFSSHGLKPLWCSTTMTSWQWDNMRQLWMSPKSSKEKSSFNSLNLLPKLHWANGWCTKRESTGEAGRKGLEAMRHLLHLEALLLSFNFRKKLDDRLGFHKRPTIDADASAA